MTSYIFFISIINIAKFPWEGSATSDSTTISNCIIIIKSISITIIIITKQYL